MPVTYRTRDALANGRATVVAIRHAERRAYMIG